MLNSDSEVSERDFFQRFLSAFIRRRPTSSATWGIGFLDLSGRVWPRHLDWAISGMPSAMSQVCDCGVTRER